MREPNLWTRSARALVVAVLAGGLLAGCSGDDASPADGSSDESSSDAPQDGADSDRDTIGSGPVQLTIDGADYRLQADVCGLGDAFSGPDGRVLVATGEGGFPKLDLTHNPEAPETDGVSLTLSDAGYRTDAGGLALSVTPNGAVGTATLSSVSSSDEVTIAFQYECPDEEAVESGDDSSQTESERADKAGFIEWNGTRNEYDSADGDLDPIEGTGLCETEDVTGLEGEDYFRISVDLDDGTNFYATSSGDLELGETLDPIDVTNVSTTKAGRTVSGTADTPQGELVFSFTC